jgi:hypothetical protein
VRVGAREAAQARHHRRAVVGLPGGSRRDAGGHGLDHARGRRAVGGLPRPGAHDVPGPGADDRGRDRSQAGSTGDRERRPFGPRRDVDLSNDGRALRDDERPGPTRDVADDAEGPGLSGSASQRDAGCPRSSRSYVSSSTKAGESAWTPFRVGRRRMATSESGISDHRAPARAAATDTCRCALPSRRPYHRPSGRLASEQPLWQPRLPTEAMGPKGTRSPKEQPLSRIGAIFRASSGCSS